MKCRICKENNIRWDPSGIIGTCLSCGANIEKKPNGIVLYTNDDGYLLYPQPMTKQEMKKSKEKIEEMRNPKESTLSPYFNKFMT